MTREILFRAKRKDNNELVYGYYSKIKHFLGLKYLHYITDEKQNYVEVIPETVSQYTGLKDKNGVEIYENDIVEYSNYMGVIEIEIIKWEENNGDVRCGYTPICDSYYDCELANDNFEVIGNKFDNLELLDKEVKKC